MSLNETPKRTVFKPVQSSIHILLSTSNISKFPLSTKVFLELQFEKSKLRLTPEIIASKRFFYAWKHLSESMGNLMLIVSY